MLLSNSRTILLVFTASLLALAACGGSQPQTEPQPKIDIKATSEFPFATDEPAEFQADITVNIGDETTDYRYFKKGDRRRIDHVSNGVVTRTYLLTDKFYTIDHTAREIAATARGSEKEADINVSPYRSPAFASPIRFRFERLSSDGDLVTYRVDTGGGDNVVSTVTVDSKTNLMMKQEFRSGDTAFVYQLKNVSLSVADGEFQMPVDYKTVTAK